MAVLTRQTVKLLTGGRGEKVNLKRERHSVLFIFVLRLDDCQRAFYRVFVFSMDFQT